MKLRDWRWCKLVSRTRYKHYYKLPVSGRVLEVDTRTGIGIDPVTGKTGSWYTWKQSEYGVSRLAADVEDNPEQLHLF